MKYSYVTVISNDKYYPGLCALVYSLKRVHSRYPLSVVIPENMDRKTKELIHSLGLQVIEADEIDLSSVPLADNLEQRWNTTFFKLRIFELVQFDKIVFLDSDMIVVQNIDELFEKPHMSCVAAGYCAHKDWTRFNSGMMVIVPDKDEYQKMISAIPAACEERKSLGQGFGDQDVINYCYPNWFNQKELVLSEEYNVISFCIHPFSSTYGYKNMKVLHFAEVSKPWQWSEKVALLRIISCIRHRDYLRARIIMLYMKHIKKSCPNYTVFN